jgi:hypothetical protein
MTGLAAGGTMRTFLRTSLKVLLGLVVTFGAASYLVVNHSAKEQELTCDGYLRRGAESQPEKAYVVLTEYRWWVHLWAESDGSVQAQTDKSALSRYIPFVMKIGDGSLALFEFREEKLGKMVGGFRAANGEITITFLSNIVFVGTCRSR